MKHDNQRRKHVQRQIDRQQQLRDNALYYAASGEQVAAFTAALAVDVVDALVQIVGKRRLRGKAHERFHHLIDLVLEAQQVLEPFRGRVCLDALDGVYEALTDDPDSDGGSGGDEPTPDGPTPVPAVFVEALA